MTFDQCIGCGLLGDSVVCDDCLQHGDRELIEWHDDQERHWNDEEAYHSRLPAIDGRYSCTHCIYVRPVVRLIGSYSA